MIQVCNQTIIVEKRAEKYLDMECLAIIGWSLCDL